MQFQADLGHPFMQRRQDLAGLMRADAVNHRVVRVPLELDQRELPRKPDVERVVHEQIGDHGRYR